MAEDARKAIQQDTGTLFSGEGEDDIDLLKRLKRTKEQLDEIDDCVHIGSRTVL